MMLNVHRNQGPSGPIMAVLGLFTLAAITATDTGDTPQPQACYRQATGICYRQATGMLLARYRHATDIATSVLLWLTTVPSHTQRQCKHDA